MQQYIWWLSQGEMEALGNLPAGFPARIEDEGVCGAVIGRSRRGSLARCWAEGWLIAVASS